MWSFASAPPPKTGEGNTAAPVEAHPLQFQAQPLFGLGSWHAAATDFPAGIDHPVPGDGSVIGQRVQRIANLAGHLAQPDQISNLAVRGHAPAWDPLHGRIHASVAALHAMILHPRPG